MRRAFFHLAARAAATITLAIAADGANAADEALSMECFSTDDLFALSRDYDGVIVNNFNLREAESFIGGFPVIQLSYAVSNRSDQRAHVGVQIVGIVEGDIIFAGNADAALGVSPGSSEAIKGSITVAKPGTLDTVPVFCLAISVFETGG
ncbi:MAG: hypothetical protein JJ926_03785 [Roseitalea sp.]|nr:hypothetical protein [Roseitalea sp.]MBO6950977.1 hypothetical protein [Rhizobiaceae bacterium]MBO6591036.1 hypothetical protein [Roseitalea sp.]MBO6599706.1 hypothetical protein [Roseitalea sp.]MBO6611462.1 hypothetical protein [Roseitalea sp.]